MHWQANMQALQGCWDAANLAKTCCRELPASCCTGSDGMLACELSCKAEIKDVSQANITERQLHGELHCHWYAQAQLSTTRGSGKQVTVLLTGPTVEVEADNSSNTQTTRYTQVTKCWQLSQHQRRLSCFANSSRAV